MPRIDTTGQTTPAQRLSLWRECAANPGAMLPKPANWREARQSMGYRLPGEDRVWSYRDADGAHRLGANNCDDFGFYGLRLCGYVDEVCPRAFRHTGWFTDTEYQDETVRGIVVQLPASKGQTRFLAGADWSDSDCCYVEADTIHDTKEEAAYAADEIARIAAEEEQEYRALDRAYQKCEEERETLRETGKRLCRVVGTIRALRKSEPRSVAREACALLSEEAASLIKQIRAAKANILSYEREWDFSKL